MLDANSIRSTIIRASSIAELQLPSMIFSDEADAGGVNETRHIGYKLKGASVKISNSML